MKFSQAELYELELHKVETINDSTTVMRVVGGWVYSIFTENGIGGAAMSSSFVPEPTISPEITTLIDQLNDALSDTVKFAPTGDLCVHCGLHRDKWGDGFRPCIEGKYHSTI